MERQHQGMDRSGVRQVPEGSGKQGKMEKTGCKIICGAPTTLAVEGLMMYDDDDVLDNITLADGLRANSNCRLSRRRKTGKFS